MTMVDDQPTMPLTRHQIKHLIDKRAGAWAEAQEIHERAEKDGWTAELREQYDRAFGDVETLSGDIKRETDHRNLDGKFSEIEERTVITTADGAPGGSRDEYREAFNAYMRGGLEGASPEQRTLLQANFRAQGVGSGSIGGFTVPEGFWAKVTETLLAYGGAFAGAEVLNTTNGQDIPWPTNNDTSNTGRLLTENTQVTETALTFGQKTLGAYTFSSDLVLVSLQLLQDSGVDIESFVARKLGQRLGRVENTYGTTGTGTNQPQGYVTAGSTGRTTASATAITFEELIDLEHSVDAAYRASGRCQYKLHDLIVAYVAKLRSDGGGGAGTGPFLWQPSQQVGEPDRIHGYPYTVNNDMASTVAATNVTAAFGDYMAGQVVRRVSGGQLLRLTERYADYLQVGFIGFERMDAGVQDTSAYKLLVQHS